MSADKNYTYYIHGAEEQLCSGYLYKSPPEKHLKNQVRKVQIHFSNKNKETMLKN